jgi:hypothetical protein
MVNGEQLRSQRIIGLLLIVSCPPHALRFASGSSSKPGFLSPDSLFHRDRWRFAGIPLDKRAVVIIYGQVVKYDTYPARFKLLEVKNRAYLRVRMQ